MTLLSSVLTKCSTGQFVLFQSSSSQSSLPILQNLLLHLGSLSTEQPSSILLFCLLYPPASLLKDARNIRSFDFLGNVPGYCEAYVDVCRAMLSEVEKVCTAADENVHLVIDSVDTLCSDIGSDAETCKFLHKLLSLIRAQSKSSRLILHITTPSSLLPFLSQTSFSPSLIQLIVHPPVVLSYLASAYLTPPPPITPEAKFYSVFLPFSERASETVRLVYGPDGEGTGGIGDLVAEVIVRTGNEGAIRRRGVERTLEGWAVRMDGPCDLYALESLKGLQTVKKADDMPEPTQISSFNLNLTPSQERSRAKVPLPYAHEGKPLESASNATQTTIFYDPDSADDIDDDDPDEDLDI